MQTNIMNQIDNTLLSDLSLGLLLVDDDRRIAWANNTLSRMLDLDGTELSGRRLEDLPEATRRLLSSEPLVLAVNSGRWIRRELHADGNGSQLLAISDVSAQEQLAEENARLRQQVEDLKLTDELTGLPNKRAISQALDLHISRSRRYQNPLSVVLVHADLQQPDGVLPLSNEPLLLAVSRFLRDRLRWVDQIARWDENVFLLVLPETTAPDARGLIEKINAEQAGMPLPEQLADQRPRLAFGLACWQKGDDMRTLLRSALRDLQENLGG
jgi:diguanylate cyclase (GGDEF)-like protein